MLCSADGCDKTAPGHGLRPIQARVAAATPSKWRDGIVTSASAGGWTGIVLVDSGQSVWVWHHANLSRQAVEGAPVALHELYGTLALGSERVNVLVAPELPDEPEFAEV
jgi:hypothetical protein